MGTEEIQKSKIKTQKKEGKITPKKVGSHSLFYFDFSFFILDLILGCPEGLPDTQRRDKLPLDLQGHNFQFDPRTLCVKGCRIENPAAFRRDWLSWVSRGTRTLDLQGHNLAF